MSLAYEFKGFILDLDGVIWHGKTLIPGADEVLKKLRGLGKKILFLTNNASKSREDYVRKLTGFGIQADANEVITSGYVTAEYIKKKYGPSKLYVVGMEGLTRELSLAGHTTVSEEPDVVVVGMDESFTYDKLLKSFQFIHYDGARLVAANDDAIANREDSLVPVAGSILASIEYATNVKAEVCGKPHKPMVSLTLSKLGLPRKSALMVGDNIDTDIAFGVKAGFATALVLSGVSKREDAVASSIKPDYIIKDITEMLKE